MICQHCENEQEATVYCHSRRDWYCQECAELDFNACVCCGELDIEDAFELNNNGELECPHCITSADAWEDTKDWLEQCIRRGIV